jgi:hypothetical protein
MDFSFGRRAMELTTTYLNSETNIKNSTKTNEYSDFLFWLSCRYSCPIRAPDENKPEEAMLTDTLKHT